MKKFARLLLFGALALSAPISSNYLPESAARSIFALEYYGIIRDKCDTPQNGNHGASRRTSRFRTRDAR